MRPPVGCYATLSQPCVDLYDGMEGGQHNQYWLGISHVHEMLRHAVGPLSMQAHHYTAMMIEVASCMLMHEVNGGVKGVQQSKSLKCWVEQMMEATLRKSQLAQAALMTMARILRVRRQINIGGPVSPAVQDVQRGVLRHWSQIHNAIFGQQCPLTPLQTLPHRVR